MVVFGEWFFYGLGFFWAGIELVLGGFMEGPDWLFGANKG
jgi:hypothetical protein